MIDLTQIQFIGGKNGVTDIERDKLHYSFVGIKKNNQTNKFEFWLPVGFNNFDNDNFDTVKTFFFRMYKTLKKYVQNKVKFATNELDNQRDGVREGNGGFSFSNENNDNILLYAKLNALDKILEGYDELKISSLSKRSIKSRDLDYSKLYKYLHQAIYLDGDVAFIDEMNLAKPVITPETPPILQLFCFIYSELKEELEEYSSINDQTKELANLYKENYLRLDSSLFDEKSFQDTITILKNSLDEITEEAIYKDENFWHFYDAIEAFLYGENDFKTDNDIYWGISNFYDVWEELCQDYMLNHNTQVQDFLLFADVKGKLVNFHELEPNPFCLSMDVYSTLKRPRYIRPDLVYYMFGEGKQKIMFDDIIEASHRRIMLETRLIKEEYKPLYIEFWNMVTDGKGRKQYNLERDAQKVSKEIYEKAKKEFEKKLEAEQINKEELIIKIIDYKYLSRLAFDEYIATSIDEGSGSKNKVKDDIKKQLIYEWTVQQNLPEITNFPVTYKELKTYSEFWIPYYSDEENFESSKMELCDIKSCEFKESKISVVQVNFNALQKKYIEE